MTAVPARAAAVEDVGSASIRGELKTYGFLLFLPAFAPLERCFGCLHAALSNSSSSSNEYPFSLANISYCQALLIDVGANTLSADTSDALPYVRLLETLVGSLAGRTDGVRGGGLTLRCLCSGFGFDVLEKVAYIDVVGVLLP